MKISIDYLKYDKDFPDFTFTSCTVFVCLFVTYWLLLNTKYIPTKGQIFSKQILP